MKVLITGATGLIGQEIVKLCSEHGISVHYLTTRKNKITHQEHYKGFYWNPLKGEIDPDCLAGVDAIINLVGASVAKRWTEAYKREIIESRTKSSEILYKTLDSNQHHITQIISASAIGIYPDSLTNYYEEDTQEVDSSFLGKVVQTWEESVGKFKSLGLKVCKIRIGLVLSDKGGALPQIVQPIKYFAGAVFGSGNQWQSWIHIDDLAALFLYAIQNNLDGVYNGVAPNPVTNNDLTKIAAEVLNRPLILPGIPQFIMKLLLGDMHVILFASQRVSSKKLETEGFIFKYHHLQPALENLLK